MAPITSDTTDRVAAIIGDTLNGWFQPHLNFAPIVVRQRHDDWYGEDYLEAWIVWEGDHDKMDFHLINSLHQFVYPLLDERNLDLRLSPHFMRKENWELYKERILK